MQQCQCALCISTEHHPEVTPASVSPLASASIPVEFQWLSELPPVFDSACAAEVMTSGTGTQAGFFQSLHCLIVVLAVPDHYGIAPAHLMHIGVAVHVVRYQQSHCVCSVIGHQ